MLKNTVKYVAVMLVIVSLPLQSMAWGMLGHRIVGEIAESYLSKNARKAVKNILGNESLAMCSNWADFIKSDTNYNYISKWHYVNVKAGLTQAEVLQTLESDTSANAFTKVNFLVAQLKNRQLPMEEQAMYLKLLVHIVGDVHQPMHVGRFEDLGGNKIRVKWFGDSYNLHQVWDEVLINFQQLSYTEFACAINHTTRQQLQQWQAEPMPMWYYHSYKIANQIYADVKEPEEKLGYQYNYKYKNTLEQQLLIGGVHLAGLLNEIYR